MKHTACFICLVAFSIVVGEVRGQPLADRVPADSIVYLGWRGADDPGSAYAGSNLKAIVDHSNFKALFNDFLPRLILKIGQKDKNAAEALGAMTAIGGPLWRHPTAMFFNGVNGAGPRGPVPKFALICQAGAESPALLQTFQSLIEKAHDDHAMLRATQAGDLVIVSTGYGEGEAIAAGVEQPGGPRGLDPIGPDRSFVAALGQVQSDPVSIAYVNVEKALELIDMFAGAGGPESREKWIKVRDALGLQGLRRIVATCGFDGQDFSSQAFIDAPAPRKGLAAMMESDPVSQDLLKSVPQDSSFVLAGTVDLARLIELIRNTAGEIDAQAKVQVDQGLGAVSMFLGKNLQTEILEPLGAQWLIYSSPTVAGRGLTGAILVNKLDDPKRAEQGLQSLAIAICNGINGQTRSKDVAIRYQQTKIGDVNVNYFGTPLITPSWTIKDGYLYAGLFPQNVATAARASMMARGGKSIADNADFVALRKRLNVDKPTSVSYLDMRPTAADGYQFALALMRLGLGMGDLVGVKAPEPVLPTFDVIVPLLSPAGGVSYVDEAGFHVRSVTPFPGAEMLGSQQSMGVAAPAFMMSILLPSLNRARETANRVKCASNERQIGMAILLYANENKGRYPDNLGQLVKTQDISIDAFVCPSAHDRAPSTVRAMDLDGQANWVNQNSSYIYVGKGQNNTLPADALVLYEKPEDHDHDGMNMLFGDGHVEFQLMPAAEQLIQKAN